MSERSKVLYAGTHLEGPAFTWFQALFRKWPADLPSNLAPEEIKDWETFQCSLTQIYGDPNLEATSERELRRLRQTGSVSEYAAKFESLKQYLSWNDAALRDQFYLNLRDDVKDELVPLDRPQTLSAFKELATHLDSRLEERRREHRNPPHPPSNPRTTNRPQRPPPAPPTSSTPLPALRTPSHTTDGTVPMELDATGAWRLAPHSSRKGTSPEARPVRLLRRKGTLCNPLSCLPPPLYPAISSTQATLIFRARGDGKRKHPGVTLGPSLGECAKSSPPTVILSSTLASPNPFAVTNQPRCAT